MEFEHVMGACVPNSACYCNNGYVRDKNGVCIKRENCPAPPKCGKGEEWSDCGSSCPKSCDNRDNTCLMCTMNCVPGCYCAGTTIRGPNNTCVEPKDCPKRTCTGDNEYFDPCPPTCPRGEKCENLWSKIPCTPIDCCDPQCRCKTGYFRNDQNKCVTAKECAPAECDKGKVYSECGSSCPPSCENRGNTCLVCTAQCVPGCFCAKGTIRAPNNTCVKPDNCPRPHCGPNEEFVKCPPTCPRTDECKNLWSKVPCTPIDCCHPQCRCKSGFYRKNGVCVRAKEC
ncbi:mucin-6-like [Cydia fagiglandana]|uniref:mucin-6-like n=1 Tax=Cydia fagiglandana TaxID=1458189 RepID=UPI002FEE198E